jgi:hypothetical protein
MQGVHCSATVVVIIENHREMNFCRRKGFFFFLYLDVSVLLFLIKNKHQKLKPKWAKAPGYQEIL